MKSSNIDIERGSDRRSLYTKDLIKGSFLELLKTHSFTSISVTALAEKAGIGRNTFYRHFSNTFEVLEASIDDALAEIFTVFTFVGLGTEGNFKSYVAPFCEYVINTNRYRLLFTDPDLSSIVIGRTIAYNDRIFARSLEAAGLTPKQAEAVLRLQAAGMLEVCTTYANAKDEEKAEVISALELL